MGIIAQIANFLNLITTTIHLGSPVGLTTRISAIHSEDSFASKSKIKSYIWFFGILFLTLSVLASFLSIIFSEFILNLLIGDSEYRLVFIIMMLSIPFVVIYAIIESFLRSFARINHIVKISVLSSIFSLLLLIPLVYFLNMNGVGIYVFSLGFFPVLIFIFFYRKEIKKLFKEFKINLSKGDKLIVFKIGVVSLFSSFLHQGSLLILRRIIIDNFGLESNGIYQAVLSISYNSFTLIYIFLINYTLPKISSFKKNNEIIIELNNNLRLILIILIPIIISILTYRGFIIEILYSKSFSQSGNLLYFQLIGDFFRAVAALFGLWLIAKVRIKQLLFIDLIFNSIFVMIPLIYISLLGKNFQIFPISYMIAYIIHFSLIFIYSCKSLRFKFKRISFRNIFLSFFVVLLSFSISFYHNNVGYFINVLLLFVWFITFFQYQEKRKMWLFLKNKFS